jgi:DegV family protein with EDD domain
MTTLKVIADSTCDLPVEIIEQYNIGIIPLNVVFENEVRKQYVDLKNDEFYERLVAGESPTTGIPSPNTFKEAYDKGLEEADQLIVLTISSALSGTYNVARMVKKQFYQDEVTVVDSRCATLQFGLFVLEVARRIEAGDTKKEILEYINKTLLPNTHLLSYAESLKYLHRSGRISKLTQVIGDFLRIKPIFHIDDAEILAPGKVMLGKSPLNAFKKLLEKIAGEHYVDTIIIGYSGNIEKAHELRDHLISLPNCPSEVLVAEVGPAIGVHVGPNTIGIAWVGNYSDEWFKHL